MALALGGPCGFPGLTAGAGVELQWMQTPGPTSQVCVGEPYTGRSDSPVLAPGAQLPPPTEKVGNM